MSAANKIKIICNPFKKEIEYKWYDDNTNQYVELEPEKSKLASDEFVMATIQNKAYEIIDVINGECNVGNVGLEIIFSGTKEDYEDICRVIETYYSECNIKCSRDTNYYNSATEVMPEIKCKFSNIRETLEMYKKSNDIAQLIHKYNDAIKPSISLCIIGLYSAGKSAFINSIVGAEILPSASDPTTAKVHKITCSKKFRIRFKFDNVDCVLTFKDGKYKPNCSSDKDIIKKLQEIVETSEIHDEVYNMNAALKIINNYENNQHEISDMIEIELPFKKTHFPVDEFDFVLYDTPGSNSKNNDKHFKVLRDALDGQTNALPIFVTTPDTMDAEDNDKILKLIEDSGTALDKTNAMMVVNKSDEKGPKALREKRDKREKLILTKWSSSRIFFNSSVIGIASKKDNPNDYEQWLDEDMYEIYDEKKSKYINDERKLFEFNIIDKSRISELENYENDILTVHLYKNSGLEAIEREFIEYAQRYALYNKCQQASIYLQQAVDKIVGNIKETENKSKEALNELEKKFNDKETELCDRLSKKKKDSKTSYNTEFQKLMQDVRTTYIKENNMDEESQKTLIEQVEGVWKGYKKSEKEKEKAEKEKEKAEKKLAKETKKAEKKLGKTEKKVKENVEKKEKEDKDTLPNAIALARIQDHIEHKLNDLLNVFFSEANSKIVNFWNDKSSSFKKECLKIVRDSTSITEEQKGILEKVVMSKDNMRAHEMDFNLRENGTIKKRRFLFWELKSEKFSSKECVKNMVESFDDQVSKILKKTISNNNKNFDKWTDELISTLKEELCKFNSELKSYRNQIEMYESELEEKEKCRDILKNTQEDIEKLLDIQEGKKI